MRVKYNNLVIESNTINSIIEIFSYNSKIIEAENQVIQLNTEYFNYSPTTSRHFSKGLSKILSNNNTARILLVYHAIKRFYELKNFNYTDGELQNFITMLGYNSKIDERGDCWLIVSL